MHQARHINQPGKAIGKRNAQTQAGKGLDCGYAPPRPGRKLCIYGSGRIFDGI